MSSPLLRLSRRVTRLLLAVAVLGLGAAAPAGQEPSEAGPDAFLVDLEAAILSGQRSVLWAVFDPALSRPRGSR